MKWLDKIFGRTVRQIPNEEAVNIALQVADAVLTAEKPNDDGTLPTGKDKFRKVWARLQPILHQVGAVVLTVAIESAVASMRAKAEK